MKQHVPFHRRKALPLAALSVSAVLALGACGGSDPAGSAASTTSGGSAHHEAGTSTSSAATPTGTATSGTPAGAGTAATGEHNDADIQFATGMIPHHRQALEMAKLAAEHAQSPEVKALAGQIEAAQAPEIERMTGWLSGWGAPVPAEGDAHAGHGMKGMLSPEQLKDLSAAKGQDFDVQFLTGMVAHHEGAVEMAETELAEGANAEAKALAQEVKDSQSGEIEQMRSLITGLGG